jgi:hypothetical protein
MDIGKNGKNSTDDERSKNVKLSSKTKKIDGESSNESDSSNSSVSDDDEESGHDDKTTKMET